MIRNRSSRVLATLGVSISLALGALAPVTVLAAQAQADFSSTAVLDAVSPDGFIAYDVSFVLADGETSNLAQLFMQATTPADWDLVGIESGAFPGTCNDTGTDLACTFGSYGPDDDAITMRVVYQVDDSLGDVTVEFKFNTTGVSGDKKKRSHGDDYIAADPISISDNGEYAGSYVQTAGAIVANDPLSRRNDQSVAVHAPVADIPVSLNEDDDLADCQAEQTGCFGNGVILNVGGGADFAPGGFQVDISYNVNKPGAEFIHFFNDGTFENLAPCGETPVAPCASVMTAQGKTFATLFLNENGKVFGH